MKPFRVVLVVALLAGGVWWIVAGLNQRQPAPEDPTALAPELNAESVAMPDAASTSVSETAPAFIDKLWSRSYTIYLVTGRFTVEDANGQVLAYKVTEEDFAKLLPELFGEYRQMHAEGLPSDNKGIPVMLPNGWQYARLVRKTGPKGCP